MDFWTDLANDVAANRSVHCDAAQPFVDEKIKLMRKWAGMGRPPDNDENDKLDIINAKIMFCDAEARGEKFTGDMGWMIAHRGGTWAHWRV